MNNYIRALFDKAIRFDEGEYYNDPEYGHARDIVICMESLAEKLYGPNIVSFLEQYQAADADADYFESLHYFQQGYLAGLAHAKKEPEA